MANKKTTKDKIKAYAKELYMVPDKKGKHEYSCETICNKVKQKFKQKANNLPKRATVYSWAQKINENGVSWESEFLASVSKGITSGLVKEAQKEGKCVGEAVNDITATTVQIRHEDASEINRYSSAIIKRTLKSIINTMDKLEEDSTEENKDGEKFIPYPKLIQDIPDIAKLAPATEQSSYNRMAALEDATANKSDSARALEAKTKDELLNELKRLRERT